ncbi:hypothetical protein M406DRAFT_355493 [Cryphonectria parasitica EP155]|uniref:Protein kinase domain-containing protein n=1 Tax=Cryphonectria parasitica (strain ATCC 38755 / EP155) TaxID=660469 RepID=A0A9P4Y5P5_CRYP1|nr:uncharacterized protein M406DRAFT_355493 [Cryphonectria parasitica EP155]KAF3767188.1 hypothetical protein M406DRAFT_355493 [Cryphonectria parasitica EP155]
MSYAQPTYFQAYTPPQTPAPYYQPPQVAAAPLQPGPYQQQPLTPPASPPPPTTTTTRFRPAVPEDRLGCVVGGRFRLEEVLGSGAYGVVYTATDVITNTQYAVKTLPNFNPDGSPLDQRQIAFKTREIRLHWMASSHPNVVSMLKIIDDYDCTYVILEYCPEGDLFYNITDCERYIGDDVLAKRVFLQLLDAVDHCHNLEIYHRDLKPENILVTDQGNTVKLADFGLATSSRVSEDYGCGSTFYMSPECLDLSGQRDSYYCAPNDVWSLGVILVNLTCGRNPWKQASSEDSTYREYTRNPEFLKTILPVSDELNDILGTIFTRDPAKRTTLPILRQAILSCSQFTRPPPSLSSHQQPSAQFVPQDAIREDAVCEMEDFPASPASDSSSDASSDSASDVYSDSSSDASEDDVGSTWDLSARPSQQSSLDGMDYDDRAVCNNSPAIPPQPVPSQPSGPLDHLQHFPQPVPVQQHWPVPQPIGPITLGHCAPPPVVGLPQQIWGMVGGMMRPFLQASHSTAIHYQVSLHSQVSIPVPGLGF